MLPIQPDPILSANTTKMNQVPNRSKIKWLGVVTLFFHFLLGNAAHAQIYVVHNNESTVSEYTTSGAPVNTSLITAPSGYTFGPLTSLGSNLLITESNFGSPKIAEYTTSGATVNPSFITGAGSFEITVSGSYLYTSDDRGIGKYTLSGTAVNATLITHTFDARLALSGTAIFATQLYSGLISEYTTSGATVSAPLISEPTNGQYLFGVGGLAISGTNLFIANSSNGPPDTGYISVYTLSGTLVNAALITGLPNPTGIAISGSYLYILNSGDGTGTGSIGKYNLDGTPVNAALVTGLNEPDFFTVISDDTPATDTPTMSPGWLGLMALLLLMIAAKFLPKLRPT